MNTPYFVRRRSAGRGKAQPPDQATTYTRFPEVQVVADRSTHLVLAALPGLGPAPDVHRFGALLFAALACAAVAAVLADAGYDSEANHRLARDGCGVRSVMPATHGRPPKDPSRPPSGRHRAMMRRLRDHRCGQRWQVECVFSMVKRRPGPAVLGRSGRTRNAEMMLKLVTHNLMILAAGAGRRLTAVLELIYRAGGVQFVRIRTPPLFPSPFGLPSPV